MSALTKIRKAGFNVALVGESFKIIPASSLTQNQREFLTSHRAEIVTELRTETYGLLAADRQNLLDYMGAIDETDPEMIDELLDECSKEPDKLAWALNWANKVLSAQVQPEQSLITCRNCQYFQCYNAHGGGAGKCGVGITSPGLCWWGETHHDCEKYQSKSIIIDQLPG